MKPSIMKFTTTAAIGMSLYAVHCFACLFPITWEWTRRWLPIVSVKYDALFYVDDLLYADQNAR